MMKDEDSVPGKATGRRMLTISWIIALAGLTFVFGLWEKKQYNPNMSVEGSSSEQSQTVVLKRNAMGHYVVSGTINNVPVVFMLDTGATSVVVPSALARKLSLKSGARYQVSTANGDIEVRGTRIQSLQFGSISLNNINAAINSGMEGEEILLGMSVLKQLDFYQSGDVLTLTQNLQ